MAGVTTNAAHVNNLPWPAVQNSRDVVDDNKRAITGGLLSNATELDKEKATNQGADVPRLHAIW
jgi:hypothetical protein